MLRSHLKYIVFSIFLISNIIQAQFYFFGRNKVQYERFDWRIIKTDHFNIFYYGEFGELAEIGAYYAEEAFDELKVKFNHIVTTRIPLIFYNTHIHFQQTNTIPGFIPEGVGGFFEFLKGRVVIPYLGSLSQFKHVIRHELVHVFMTSKVINSMRDHRVLNDKYPPLWFVEGLAEFWSTDWDTQADMVMRDAVLNGIFVPLRDINSIYGSFLMYKEGQSFLEFLKLEYGEEKIVMILDNLWRFSSFSEVLVFTLGDTMEEIDDKWLFYLKKKYYPLYENKLPHSIGSKKLTNFGFNFTPNYYEKDSIQSIYFVGNRDGYSSVFRLPYFPDAKIYVEPERIIKGEKEKIMESFHLFQSAIHVSRNGLIAFVTKSGGTDALHIYSIEEDKILHSLQRNYLISIRAPKFSSDSRQIVFNAIDQKGYSDIFIFNIADYSVDRLTNDYYDDKDPVFGPNDLSVIFASDRTEGAYAKKYNLFEYDMSAKFIRYITYVDADISTPKFAPHSGELYFNCDYDGTFNIWKLVEGKAGRSDGMTQQTSFVTGVFDFTFVDSTELVTSAFESFSFQFYSLKFGPEEDREDEIIFNFDLIGKKWRAKSIALDSKTDRLVYEKEYTLDYAVGQLIADPVYGAQGGALFSLSDLLGDDRFLFLIYNNAEMQSEILRNFNVAVTRINSSSRTNFAYGIFNFTGRRYDLRDSDDFFYERNLGGFFALIYPFSSFQRLEARVSIAKSDREIDFLTSRKALLVSNSLNFVHDNSLWGPTGPMDGTRMRFLVGYTSDVKFSNVNYYSIIADYRQYLRTSLRTSIALRASIFVNHGKEARRYIAGGSWDLRGWPRYSIRGEKLWVSSIEFRFPLIDRIGLNLPFLGLAFPGIIGAAFFDVGGAWDDIYTETLGSLGVGFRINLFNVIVFRYDIGKKIENNFTNFQPKLFYQFFFGFDF